jgi:dTDP-glucose 4,6-dehydratase
MVLRRGITGQAYNVAAADNERENLEVVHAILEQLGKPRSLIRHVEDRPGHDRRYGIDATRITNELGWRPRRDWRQTLHDTVDWYVANPGWWQAIRQRDPRFQEFYDRQYGQRLAPAGRG